MGKAALVTGGSKRLGRAISLYLARRGYDIAIHYNQSSANAKETASIIKEKGGKCKIFQSDLNDVKQARVLALEVLEAFPRCAILVNSASVFENIGFHETTEETFDRDFNVNFKSPFFLSQDFSKGSGAKLIINMLDTRVNKTETAYFTYNLSKKVFRDFTLAAARSLGPKIRVNAICPGAILPPPDKGVEYIEKMTRRIPLQSPGDPNHVVTAVKYILDNPFVTGECLFVDGGERLT